jgi:flagella basal body P-ring formation protein FlgA
MNEMKMNKSPKLLLLLAALFAAGMAAPCSAASTRGEVFLDSDSIKLGDLFDGVGEKAASVIAKAPAPGKKVVYDVSALQHVAQSAGLDWMPLSNYERVTLTRNGEKMGNDQITALVREELKRQNVTRDMDVVLDNKSLEIWRASGVTMQPRLADFRYDPLKNRFTGNLLVMDDKGGAEVVELSGRAMMMVNVAILSGNVSAGTTITDADIEWTRVPQDKAGADALAEGEQMKDIEARRNLATGTVLRLRDIRGARLVTKGSLVTMSVETAVMSLSTQGRALTDGALGDTIRVLNTQSNRTVDAVVTANGKVAVMPPETAPKIALK